jgi:hypothetical protein
MVLVQLFIAFLKIGLFAFGGAYSFVPLIEREVVQNHQWLAKAEFLEILGIVKVFPGAISIKFATYTGYKVAGVPGAIVANFANILALIFKVQGRSVRQGQSGDDSVRRLCHDHCRGPPVGRQGRSFSVEEFDSRAGRPGIVYSHEDTSCFYYHGGRFVRRTDREDSLNVRKR